MKNKYPYLDSYPCSECVDVYGSLIRANTWAPAYKGDCTNCIGTRIQAIPWAEMEDGDGK